MESDSASELVDQFGPGMFRAVHRSDQDGLVYFRADGTVEYINRAAMRLFSISEEMIGENILEMRQQDFESLPVEVIYPSDHFAKARATYESGRATRSEMVVIDDGERREIEVLWGPVEQDGEIVGVVGSYRDISPRPDIHDHLAEEASQLEDERRFLASIIDGLDRGVVVFDGHAAVQLVNPAAAEMLGLETPVGEMPLGEFLDAAALEHPDRFADQLRRTTSGGESTRRTHSTGSSGEIGGRLEAAMRRAGLEQTRIVCTLADPGDRPEIEQMNLLSRVASFSTEPGEVDRLAERIVEAIAGRLPIDFAVITRRRGSTLRPIAWRGLMLDEQTLLELEERPAIRDLLDAGGARRLDEGGWQADGGEAIGEVVVSLASSGEPIGTLHLGAQGSVGPARSTGPALDAVDLAFIEALGNYVAGAMENAILFEQSTRKQTRLEATIETLPEGVMLYNRRGEVLMANSAAAEITGVSEWSNLNTEPRPYRVLAPDRRPLGRSEWPFFRAVQTGDACRREVIFDFGRSEQDLVLEAAPIDSGASSPEMFVGLLRDITDRRELDRRKDEFLSIASHELRSPLTPLTGVLQLARRQRERGDQVDLSLLRRAERQVTRLTRLIDGLLDLTRIETDRIELERRRLDFGAFVRERIRPWELNPKGIELELSIPEQPLEVSLDPDRFHQVLTNLVDNAIKYSDSDQVVRIEVRDRGETAELVIEDHGVGMDQETISHIFDRFFHGHDAAEGPRSMGLGLYICRQIVEQHDGTITVDSEPGVGTRVEIVVPTAPEQ